MTFIELSEEQLQLVLSGIQCAINEGYSEDQNILFLRYLRDKYNIDIFPYNDTRISSERVQEALQEEVWAPTRDKDGNIIAYYDTGERRGGKQDSS